MSLRIYIKGPNKLGSPNKGTSSASQLPQFNQIPQSKVAKPSKKCLHRDASKENSAILEPAFQESEYSLRSYGDHTLSAPSLKKKMSTGFQNDRYFEHSGEEKIEVYNPRSKQEIQKDKQEYAKKLINRNNLSDKQLRTTIQDCDNLIMSLFEEVERLQDLYSQKNKEVEALRDLDNSKINFEGAGSETEKSDIVRLRKENVRLIDMVRRLTDSNTELTEETSLLREMASSSEQNLQKERESFKNLRDKAESLVTMNDELNARLEEKENETRKLNNNLQQVYDKNLKLVLDIKTKEQTIEEFKRTAFLGEVNSSMRKSNTFRLHNDDVNTSTTIGYGTGIYTVNLGNTPKPESLKNSSVFPKEDLNEWKTKFETSKNENSKLVKIIEGNQQVIKDLKQALTSLETTNAQRFEELKTIYENKIKSLLNTKNETKVPSSYHHSKKTSQENIHLPPYNNQYL